MTYFGRLAQLGERLVYTQKVISSSLVPPNKVMRHAKPYRLYFRKETGYFFYMVPGGKWKTTGQTKEPDAHRFVIEQVLPALKQPPESDKPSHTFKQYADPFFGYERCPHIRRLLDEGKSYTRRTAKQNRGWLKKYVLEDELATMPLAEISRADLIDFRSRLRKQLGEKRNTVNKVMGVIKTIFKEALYREDLEKDPTSGIGNIKEERKAPDTFNLEELQLLFPIETLGPWRDIEDHTCFLIAAATGMRRGEVLALRWEQIHIDYGYILVDRARKDAFSEGKPKWEHVRTARIVLFKDRVKQRLLEHEEGSLYTAPDSYVFCDAFGNPHGFTWWKARFAAAMKKFNPDPQRRLSPNGLRHSLATILRVNGKDPVLIRASLGWYQERTQSGYEHISAEDLESLEIVE